MTAEHCKYPLLLRLCEYIPGFRRIFLGKESCENDSGGGVW